MTDKTQAHVALTPLSFTIGLWLLAFFLSGIGFGLRMALGEPVADVIVHAVKIMPIFLFGIPLLFCIGAYLMNYFKNAHIHMRNAWTLGELISCVSLITIMGIYS